MRTFWVLVFLIYRTAVFFSYYNDKKCLKIKNQTQSGLNKPETLAGPPWRRTPCFWVPSPFRCLDFADLEKKYWRLSLQKSVDTQQCALGATASFPGLWSVVFGQIISRVESRRSAAVTFQSFLFIDIQYQFMLHKQVGPAWPSAHSEQSIAVLTDHTGAPNTSTHRLRSLITEPSGGTCHFESLTNIFNTMSDWIK